VTDPLGNDTVHQVTGFFGGPSLFETQTRYYQGSQSSGTLLKTVNTDYSYSSNPFDHIGANVNPPTAINVVPIRVTTILPNGLVTKEETDHDSAFTFRDPFWGLPIYPPLSYTSATYSGTLGTVSARREYDYGAGSAGNLLRQTFTTYLWQGNSNYLTANMLDLPSSVVVKDGNGNRVAETDSTYDEAQYLSSSGISTQHQSAPNAVRGNLTTVSKWLSTSTNPVVTHTNWYDTGEVFQTIDALGNATTHSYDPAYVGAYSTKTCNSLSQCVSGTYDFNSGALTSFTDQNAASQASGTTQGDPAHTSNYGYDNMFRMTQALLPPDANAVRPETDFYYPNSTTVQRCRKQLDNAGSACGSGWIVDYAYFDGLGRTTQTRLADPAGDDYVDTTYDTLGRVSTVSNPHRNNSTNSTDGITTSHYDALSRVTSITKQDGSASSVQYDQAVGTANCTIATDEAGKQRKTCSDGLGRLMKVWEDPAGLSYETDYQYDALGNLLRVDQKGSAPGDSTQWRTRLFTYDSLSQLLSAQNPESGTITYQYDNAGNMIYKGDPRGSHITYAYDQLHRLILKTPSDGTTPIVNYTYDQTSVWGHTLTNGIGRMTSESVFTNWGQPYIQAALFGYDALGHMTNEWDCLPSTCPSSITYPISAAYNPAGEMTSLTYPDGQVINYSYDVAAHALSAIGADNTNYVYNATYYPNGAQYRQWWTPNIYARTDLNNRLQVAAFYSDNGVTPAYYLSKTYSYGAQNNGNVLAIYNNKDSSRTQSFTYDSLNRLTHAENSGTDCTQTLPDGHTEYWGNNYVYDAWGNLYQKNVTKCSAENLQVSVTAQNRLTGYSYDAAGNMTGDGIHTATYDAENRLTQVSSGIASYLYDSEGNRVSKNAGGISTEYVYFGGNAIAERNPSAGNWTDYIFFNGKRVARRDPSGAVHYYLSDHLGSTTMVVNAAGTIENESDYYPWGGELKISAADSGNHYKFTGKERDAETGLDYFGARYYSNGMGRWLSPDWAEKPEAVPYAELGDPQSLNLYGYVRNLPTTRHDADGHLQQDQNGNIKFRKTGEATVTFIDEKVSPGSDINIQIKWSADIGYVKADDGTKIKASKATGEMKVTLTDGDGLTLKSGGSELLPPGFSNTADCHGTTFAKGQVWIDNDQTSKIIKGDHYQPTGSPQTDDVGVYTRNGNLKETVHSVRVTGTDTSGQVSSVSSKGGITPKMETTPGPGPGTAWRDPSVKLTYYTQHVEP
jgi:RHS repeat-associated protein